MFKIICIFFICISIQGCFENTENKHIKEYEYNVDLLINDFYSNAKLSKNIEDLHERHNSTLNEFNKLKAYFSKFDNEKKLQTIISLYDYALTHLIIRQIQIIELSFPLWNDDPNKLHHIKNFNYYQKHQFFLNELTSMLEEYNDLILIHQEEVRKKLVSSGLSSEDRKKLWPLFNVIVAKHLSTMKPLINPIQTRVEFEIKLVSFLYENKEQYLLLGDNKLYFKSSILMMKYKRLKREARSAQMLSNITNL